MKTYTLSVNTLMRNMTSERHDNCAPCLDLILPIRWVTPPPNTGLKCFFWRGICKVFAFGLSSTLIWLHVYLQCWFDLIYTYTCVLSSTTFTYSYVFLLESVDLSECDQTLTSSMLLSQILSIQIICILLKLSKVFSASLSAEDIETKVESVLMQYPYCLKPGEVGTTTRQSRRAWEHGTTSHVLHDRHVSFRCESPEAPV